MEGVNAISGKRVAGNYDLHGELAEKADFRGVSAETGSPTLTTTFLVCVFMADW